ncbi:hypothetical protein C7Y47_13910 [Lysinibacillus sphaericus]|uniref:Uncharacterized protein n=1 Tax=Lysinibacillus sphaericus TaxID=1421 RepID=A0A544UGA9_LYSSH|nr:hypothetical protein [Lysinibacillus sp. SDF0037]TQR31711.1 hypothetical protein C7Y47_13910 [Lysinibacillus sp. SDF0037]
MKSELIWQRADSLRADLIGCHLDGLKALCFLKYFNTEINLDELQNFSKPTLKERIQFSLQGSEMD